MEKIKVYTRTGDNGTSLLFNMQRKEKDAVYFEALGDTDELTAHLGVAYTHCVRGGCDEGTPLGVLAERLREIQSRLLDLGSHIATPLTSSNEKRVARTAVEGDMTSQLEQWIDEMEETLPPLTNFILPSGGEVASTLHVARTVARRAERTVVPLVRSEECDPVVQRYLNRLSDFLFVAARFAAKETGHTEVVYKKAK